MSTFTLCSAAPCLFCFEAICDRYFFKLNCFKLIGWFYHHNVFPPIRSVCYRFFHCTLLQIFALLLQIVALLFGIKCTEINQSQSSNILMYIISTVNIAVHMKKLCCFCFNGVCDVTTTTRMTETHPLGPAAHWISYRYIYDCIFIIEKHSHFCSD
jgi:hypothetical protein